MMIFNRQTVRQFETPMVTSILSLIDVYD